MFGFKSYRKLVDEVVDLRIQNGNWQSQYFRQAGKAERLTVENERLRADLDWAKHRLNLVERERSQLIHHSIGVKVAVPEFVQTYRPDEALNEANNPFGSTGEDSPDPEDRMPTGARQVGEGVDYSRMPGWKGN